MRCVSCGEEMRLLQVVEEMTMMVTGYEKHSFECSGCREVEQRLVFTKRKGPIRRHVQNDAANASREPLKPQHEGATVAHIGTTSVRGM